MCDDLLVVDQGVVFEGCLTDDVAIGLLATTFPDEMVREVIKATGKHEQRNRALPARLMAYLSMALWLDFGKGYVRVLRNLLRGLRWARGGWDGYVVPTDGAISRARDRLGSASMRALFEATAKPTLPASHEEVFWRGLRKVVVDGTVFDVPASADNAAAFVTPAGGVLPQARLVALAECGSMALLGAAFDSIAVGERSLFERLMGHLTEDMLLLADRGFPSYDLYTAASGSGAHLLWRVSDSFTLPVQKRLDDGTYLSELRGRRARDRVTVRVIEYSVSDDDGVSEVFALITTLCDPEQAPAIELARIYADRWHVEILSVSSQILASQKAEVSDHSVCSPGCRDDG